MKAASNLYSLKQLLSFYNFYQILKYVDHHVNINIKTLKSKIIIKE